MPYRTEARIEPPNNGSSARHALLHVAFECLTHWTTWAGPPAAVHTVKVHGLVVHVGRQSLME